MASQPAGHRDISLENASLRDVSSREKAANEMMDHAPVSRCCSGKEVACSATLVRRRGSLPACAHFVEPRPARRYH